MAERTTQMFMALLTRERMEEALSQEGSHGSKVVEKYVTDNKVCTQCIYTAIIYVLYCPESTL